MRSNSGLYRILSLSLIMALCLSLLAGCSSNEAEETGIADVTQMEYAEVAEEAVALADAPAAKVTEYATEASGKLEKKTSKGVIDYSNTEDGYVMVKYLKDTNKKIKAQVKGPDNTYTYNVSPKEWETFPFTDGDGEYQIILLENVSGNKYAIVVSVSVDVKLTDEFAPFLRSNQYVNYADAPNTVKKAASLTKKVKEPLDKVEKIYNYVVKKFTYDKKKAKTVQTGYVPDLDKVLKEKKGICFDYAATMAGMLRSQGIPCKLVIGYAGEAYHAWISVYVEGEGWVEGVVYFDGTSWQRMDPTFASSSKQSKAIMKYIGDGKNYTAKYFY
ncbi:MAG: transglutaminase domain-containing protein [Firmicutes bacterium]|nr:transglutaminase domain-containing protein [Bacillota bacterium]